MATNEKLETALDVLEAHGIEPYDRDYHPEDMREIGHVTGDEMIYSTSLESVFGDEASDPLFDERDGRIREWMQRLREILEEQRDSALPRGYDTFRHGDAPEPHCAWYCPIHFFGHGWGIYIREECVLWEALQVAQRVDRAALANLKLGVLGTAQRMVRAAFYGLFLHEQFHHKVESLGFRLLVGSGKDHYRPYKAHVYQPTFLTPDCIEESLANADSYRRLDEDRYGKKLGTPVRHALRSHLRASFAAQPPGYREGSDLLPDYRFQPALYDLQSRVKDGSVKPTTPPQHWQVSPDVIRSMMDVTDEIYVVLPIGSRPIFPVGAIDPRPGISTSDLVKTLERGWGCEVVPGGKGSHVKLRTPKGDQIILTGNQAVLAPRIVVQAIRKVMSPTASIHDLEKFRRGAQMQQTLFPET